jgi:ABC-type multidrug transport system fused ATPase/permease subunit
MTHDFKPDETPASATDEVAGLASLKRLFNLTRPYFGSLTAITLLMFAVTAIAMTIPKVAGDIIDSAVTPQLAHEIDVIAMKLIGLIAAMAVLKFTSSYWLSRVGAKLLHGLRDRAFAHLVLLSLNFFQRRKVGELNARLMANLDTIQNIITSDILIGVQAVVRLAGVIVILLALNPRLTMVAVLVASPVVMASMLFGKYLERAALDRNDALAESSGKVEEVFSGISTVQAFNQQQAETSRYRKLLDRLLARQLWQARLASSYAAISDLIALSALVVVIWYGGHLIISGGITVGELTACMMYMLVFATSIEDVGRLFNAMKEVTGISHRFFQILDEVPLIQNRGTRLPTGPGPLTLSFREVSFAYPSNREVNVIDSLCLDVREGEDLALVGASGAGKTTLFKLLMRFYDASSGAICIGGVPLQEYELGSLRNLFGLVSQDIFLFSGTILDNIRYGNPQATLEEVATALEAVGATDFVTAFEHGLEEQVGVGGSRLSGGQRQRLGLARVYLKNPRILLLDEATSALDSESEARVQSGLKRLKRGRTTITIAHRLATIRESDRILMLENGRIVAEGGHAYLQQNSSLYNKYWQWQSSSVTAIELPETAQSQ